MESGAEAELLYLRRMKNISPTSPVSSMTLLSPSTSRKQQPHETPDDVKIWRITTHSIFDSRQGSGLTNSKNDA